MTEKNLEIIYSLYRIDFDTLENNIGSAISSTKVCAFYDDSNGRAYKEISKWMSGLGQLHYYIGWDKQIYPQWRLEETKAY